MALRLMIVILPKDQADRVDAALEDAPVLGRWREEPQADHLHLRLLVSTEDSETVLNRLDERFGSLPEFRLILLPVEATLPRPPEPEPEPGPEAEVEPTERRRSRVSSAELYADVADSVRLNRVYVALIVLSAVVAAIGLFRGSEAVLIGAMVIAPLLGPNTALALATTLADGGLARRAVRVGLVGIGTAFALSMVFGVLFPVSPDAPEVAARTVVGTVDIALALAAGAAGALSFTLGMGAALIGVMVAVALLPPLVASGMLVGAGHVDLGIAAFALFVVNLISINLAGVVTFLAQGIRPRTYWEAGKARRATIVAIVVWLVLLVLLGVAIEVGHRV